MKCAIENTVWKDFRVTLPMIGIVVPTLGQRPEYLELSLRSIRAAGHVRIHLVAPDPESLRCGLDASLFDEIIQDPKLGLSCAIDIGLRSFPKEIEYINWLGDDDLLKPSSLTYALEVLQAHRGTSLVYGGCDYINADGSFLFTNKSGRFAKYLMYIGPQLISQPAVLFRRAAYERIGGLNFSYKWAFDLDLLMRLRRTGKLRFVPQVFASFRWHDDSLTVGSRRGSVNEASIIRRSVMPSVLRWVSPLWELPLRKLIMIAGSSVSRRYQQ
jgi:GT2 family glycosyltransferase